MSDTAEVENHEGAVIPAVRHDAGTLKLPLLLAFVALALPIAMVAVLACVLSTVIPWWIGVLVGVGIGGWLVANRFRQAHDLVVQSLVEVAPVINGSPRLANLVDSMALSGGIMKPSMLIVSDPALNAMAIRRGDELTVAVTEGLVSELELVDLEGVVAELVARLRNGDAEAATVYTVLFELPGGIMGRLLSLVAGQARRELLRDGRDLTADLQAVSLTRYPPGLFQALRRIRADKAEPGPADRQLEALWIVDPAHRANDTGSTVHVEGERAPLELRMDILAEL